MLRIRDIMTTDVASVAPDVSLRDALELFVVRRVTGAPVLEGNTIVGVISRTDLLEFAASTPPVPRVRDVEPEPWREPDDVLVGELAEENDADAAYFTDLWEDAGADAAERFRTSGGPEWDLLSEHTVAEAMSRAAYALPADTPVDSAARFMRDAGVHRVLVTELDSLAGIVTTTDIANAVADGRIVKRTYAFNRDGEW